MFLDQAAGRRWLIVRNKQDLQYGLFGRHEKVTRVDEVIEKMKMRKRSNKYEI